MRPTSDNEQSVFVPESSCEEESEKIFRVRLIFGGGGGIIEGLEGAGEGGNRSVDRLRRKKIVT